MNNLGYLVKDKLPFIEDYKFTIAFENSSYPGYTTEKILHPMLMNSIAVYWGNPLVGKDFNTKSFVNVHDYKSIDDAIDRIIEIDKNETLYRQYLAEPYLKHNEIPLSLTEDKILDRFELIFNSKPEVSNRLRLMKQQAAFFKKDIIAYSRIIKKKFYNV